jgi:Uma2 family endonuclease
VMVATDSTTQTDPRLTIEVARLFPCQGEWSESAFLSLPESNLIIELSEGKLIMMSPATETHQRILRKLFLKIDTFVEAGQLGITRFAPMPVRLWPGKIREPDILFVLRQHSDRISEHYYGPPDLVVEVLSPTTQHTDRVEKFHEYATAGISEYWIADPETETLEVFSLQDETYVLHLKAGKGGKVNSRVLDGMVIAADEIFRRDA